MNWSALPIWGPLLVLVVIAEVTKALLIRCLRVRHPYAWTELGQPGYFSKSSFDLVGRLTPYLKDAEDPVARDRDLQKLIVLRRASWWAYTLGVLAVWLFGVGRLFGIYQGTEPLSILVYMALGVGLIAAVLLAYFWRAVRRREESDRA